MQTDQTSPLFPTKVSFEDILDSTPCFLSVQDRDLRIVAANQNFVETFGYVRGRYCYEVYKQSDSKCQDCPVERSFADGGEHSSEQKVVLPDGTTIPILAYTSPVLGQNGEIEAVVEISADITGVKRLEAKLAAMSSLELRRFLLSFRRARQLAQARQLSVEVMREQSLAARRDYLHWQQASRQAALDRTYFGFGHSFGTVPSCLLGGLPYAPPRYYRAR